MWARFWERTRRVRRRTKETGGDLAEGCDIDLGEGIVVFLVAVVLILFMIFIGIPFLIALGELLVLVLLAVAGIVGRVLFRRPWTIDAVGPDGTYQRWGVVGWRASGAAQRFVAQTLVATGELPTDVEVAAAAASVERFGR
jgi:hypothetical protein